ncbi:hypothetical protein TTHERM_000085199 (macronuclear) [Tetrahymena thermophila SB210]|uniref:Uncharacterized protein n=1 Tax=Tetrahymena thermophila (strain SB210) TaxID=312017 RepID=W7XJ62_TETTS|nr:hypothetical protein TTHERM_000085199 [Tetrahymena thermophila SB210]EWS75241.1 hypothetical protein TTHERM_000085199 [Tetrahymena thermophila SB210]|eukprot:XP_012652232.1 hypothetical protein TTHERM_000085199 [Tetrahymena thermophila SB210]
MLNAQKQQLKGFKNALSFKMQIQIQVLIADWIKRHYKTYLMECHNAKIQLIYAQVFKKTKQMTILYMNQALVFQNAKIFSNLLSIQEKVKLHQLEQQSQLSPYQIAKLQKIYQLIQLNAQMKNTLAAVILDIIFVSIKIQKIQNLILMNHFLVRKILKSQAKSQKIWKILVLQTQNINFNTVTAINLMILIKKCLKE